jgi:hypothetical protein
MILGHQLYLIVGTYALYRQITGYVSNTGSTDFPKIYGKNKFERPWPRSLESVSCVYVILDMQPQQVEVDKQTIIITLDMHDAAMITITPIINGSVAWHALSAQLIAASAPTDLAIQSATCCVRLMGGLRLFNLLEFFFFAHEVLSMQVVRLQAARRGIWMIPYYLA